MLAFAAAIAFSLAAGFNDGGNLLAIAASSRTIAPRIAFLIIVAGAVAGPYLFGTRVASTTGHGIVDFGAVGERSLFAAIVGALGAVALTYGARVPTSLSAALFASMVGSLLGGPGAGAVQWAGIGRVAAAMGGSIIVGVLSGALAYRALAFVLEHVRRKTGERIVELQYVAMALLAAGYGANDLEKSSGLLAAAAATGHPFSIPAWALAVAAIAFAVGLAAGGIRIARTVGGKLFSVRPAQALAAEVAASVTVVGAAITGGPLSTTDTSASALVGVGAAVNPRTVHWHVVRGIATAWMSTVPAALVMGAVAGIIVRRL